MTSDAGMTGTAKWITRGGVEITRDTEAVDATAARAALEDALDRRRGLLLCSGHEYPGRYRIWSTGYVDPPLEITGRGRTLTARALNSRGLVLLPVVSQAWRGLLEPRQCGPGEVSGTAPVADGLFAEEERTRRPSVFGALRALTWRLAATEDPILGLYGAFGYDLAFQFDPVPLRLARAQGDRDL